MKIVDYCSSASKVFDDRELEEIIKNSSQDNQTKDVTGMLMYADGCFFQIIEGPNENIEALYRKISNDDRHTGLIKVIDEEIDQRNFPNWSMGGLRLDPTILEHKEVFELTRMALLNKLPDTAPETAKIFMKSFYNASNRNIEH